MVPTEPETTAEPPGGTGHNASSENKIAIVLPLFLEVACGLFITLGV
jgi:hypothetical protein